MNQSDRDFITQNIIQLESVKLGFVKNMDLHVLVRFEQIYKTYVQPGFVLISWCGNCVFDMMKRLAYYYDDMIAKENETRFHISENMAIVEAQEVIKAEPKRRGRPKRKP